MRAIYYISPCTTCERVRAQLHSLADWTLRDIKAEPLRPDELDVLADLAGGYEPLFSRRARLYRERSLHEQDLSEADYRRLILEHYTFLKRPVIVVNDLIYIGSSQATVTAAMQAL